MAAALSRPTTALVAVSTLEPAIDAGLIDRDGENLSFTHPLYASVIYAGASAKARRALHAELARSPSILDDPEERARHLALCTTGPDEQVAQALDDAATRADGRGAPETAGELSERAAGLTLPSDTTGAFRRITVAARHFFRAGDWQPARALLDRVLVDAPRGLERGRALQALAQLSFSDNDFSLASSLLEEAGREDDDPGFVVSVMLDRAFTIFSMGDLASALELARDALSLAEHLDDHGLLAEALAIVGAGQGFAVPGAGLDRLERAVELEDRRRHRPIHLRPTAILAEQLLYLGRLTQARAMFDELRTWFVERGGESELPFLLFGVSMLEWMEGNMDEAMKAADAAFMLAEQEGSDVLQGMSLAHRARALAVSGLSTEAYAALDRAEVLLGPTGWATGMSLLIGVRGFLDVSLGELPRAARTFAPVIGPAEIGGLPWVPVAFSLSDAVETLVGIGEIDRADRMLACYEGQLVEARVLWAASVLRCRSIVLAAQGDLVGALAVAERAVRFQPDGELPLEMGRSLLVQGMIERRLKRRAAARTSLERSVAIFEEIGAPLWAARAGAELGRLGARPVPGTLTETEERVAALAATGFTNNEVAAKLFLNRRTVESNLARAYAKLGIRSRAQLSAALGARTRS